MEEGAGGFHPGIDCGGGIADVRHMETWNNWLYPIYNFFILSFVVSGFVLLWYGKEWFRKGLSFLRQFGKMSLTNYFLQSIIGCGLFAYYGFNLQTKLGITYAFFVGIAILINAAYQKVKVVTGISFFY